MIYDTLSKIMIMV